MLKMPRFQFLRSVLMLIQRSDDAYWQLKKSESQLTFRRSISRPRQMALPMQCSTIISRQRVCRSPVSNLQVRAPHRLWVKISSLFFLYVVSWERQWCFWACIWHAIPRKHIKPQGLWLVFNIIPYIRVQIALSMHCSQRTPCEWHVRVLETCNCPGDIFFENKK